MRRILALLTALLLTLTACGGDDDDTAATTTTTAADATTTSEADEEPQPAEIVFETGDTDLGTVLVTTEGMTLYFFDPDTVDASACTEGCAQAWPPLPWLNDGTVGGDADPALLGTAEQEDGSMQATYNGHRLYTYSGDSAPGDTTGNGVGDVWHAVTPEGEAVA